MGERDEARPVATAVEGPAEQPSGQPTTLVLPEEGPPPEGARPWPTEALESPVEQPKAPKRAKGRRIFGRVAVAWSVSAVLLVALAASGAYSWSQRSRLSDSRAVLAREKARVGSTVTANGELQGRVRQLTEQVGDLKGQSGQLGSGLNLCQRSLKMEERFIQAIREGANHFSAGETTAAEKAWRRADSIGQQIDSSNIIGRCLAQKGGG